MFAPYVRPWWQQPSWTQSQSCRDLCLLLAELRKQYPELPTLAKVVGRNVAPFMRSFTVLAVGSTSSLRMLDEESGNVFHRLQLVKEADGMACAPCGRCLAVRYGGTLHFLDVATGAWRQLRPVGGPDMDWDMLCRGELGHTITCMAFSSSGTRLAAGSANGVLYVIDPMACTVTRSLLMNADALDPSSDDEEDSDGSGYPICSVAYSANGKHIVAGLDAGLCAICVIDAESERSAQIYEIGRCGALISLAFSSNNAYLFGGSRKGDLIFWEANVFDESVDWEPTMFDLDPSIPAGSGLPIFTLAFSPHGDRLAIGHAEAILHLLNPEVLNTLVKDPRMFQRLEANGQLESTIQLHRLKLSCAFSPSGRRPDIDSLAFSPSGSRLAAGIGSTLYVLDPETCTELQVVQLDADDFIYGCGYLSIADGGDFCQGCINRESIDEVDTVVEHIEHLASDSAAVIAPSGATQTQMELWAFGIEARIAGSTTTAQQLLLWTFGRHTQELESALLGSILARAAAKRAPVKPDWARGAKIFVTCDADKLQAMLPRGCVLRPWHVVLCEQDEDALRAAIAHLPEPVRRLKCDVGHRKLHSADTDSMQGNAEHEVNADIEIRHGFVHFSPPNRAESSRTA